MIIKFRTYQIFNTRENVALGLVPAGRAGKQVYGHGILGIGVGDDIFAYPAIEGIASVPAVQNVIAFPARQHIGAFFTQETVITAKAGQRILTLTADNNVIGIISEQGVSTRGARQVLDAY